MQAISWIYKLVVQIFMGDDEWKIELPEKSHKSNENLKDIKSVEKLILTKLEDSKPELTFTKNPSEEGDITKIYFELKGSRNILTQDKGLCECENGENFEVKTIKITYRNNTNEEQTLKLDSTKKYLLVKKDKNSLSILEEDQDPFKDWRWLLLICAVMFVTAIIILWFCFRKEE